MCDVRVCSPLSAQTPLLLHSTHHTAGVYVLCCHFVDSQRVVCRVSKHIHLCNQQTGTLVTEWRLTAGFALLTVHLEALFTLHAFPRRCCRSCATLGAEPSNESGNCSATTP